MDTLRERLPDPITAKLVVDCFRGLVGASATGSLAGDEGAEVRRWRGPTRSNIGRRAAEGGVVASLISDERERISREDGRGRSVYCCSRSVSEPEPPRRERAKETCELELAVDEEDEERVGGMGECDREDERTEGEGREWESEAVMEDSLSITYFVNSNVSKQAQ